MKIIKIALFALLSIMVVGAGSMDANAQKRKTTTTKTTTTKKSKTTVSASASAVTKTSVTVGDMTLNRFYYKKGGSVIEVDYPTEVQSAKNKNLASFVMQEAFYADNTAAVPATPATAMKNLAGGDFYKFFYVIAADGDYVTLVSDFVSEGSARNPGGCNYKDCVTLNLASQDVEPVELFKMADEKAIKRLIYKHLEPIIEVSTPAQVLEYYLAENESDFFSYYMSAGLTPDGMRFYFYNRDDRSCDMEYQSTGLTIPMSEIRPILLGEFKNLFKE